MIVGTQVVALGLCAHAYGTYFMNEKDPWFDRMRARFRLEHGLLLGGAIAARGLRDRRRDRRHVDRPRLRRALRGAPGGAGRRADHRRHPGLLLVVPALASSACAAAAEPRCASWCSRRRSVDDAAAWVGCRAVRASPVSASGCSRSGAPASGCPCTVAAAARASARASCALLAGLPARGGRAARRAAARWSRPRRLRARAAGRCAARLRPGRRPRSPRSPCSRSTSRRPSSPGAGAGTDTTSSTTRRCSCCSPTSCSTRGADPCRTRCRTRSESIRTYLDSGYPLGAHAHLATFAALLGGGRRRRLPGLPRDARWRSRRSRCRRWPRWAGSARGAPPPPRRVAIVAPT